MQLLQVMCACLALSSALSFPFESTSERKGKRVQFAAWDDVNVLAHGLLQLGQGLKEHVDKTKGQMRDVFVKLRLMNSSVSEASRMTQRLQENNELLKLKTQNLEERESQIHNVSKVIQERTEVLLVDKQNVHERMSRLEEKVDGLIQGEGLNAAGNYSDIRVVQWMLEAQNQRIDELMEQIKQQQEKLDKQNIRLRTLQNQINSRNEHRFLQTDDETLNRNTEQRDSPQALSSDCYNVFLSGERSSGIYSVQPSDSNSLQVYCEITAEGGWTVIQRRMDGSVDFDQLWDAYRNGFGHLDGEFWLGLEKIYSLTKGQVYILKILMTDWRDEQQMVKYHFRLDGEDSDFTLRIMAPPAGHLESALSSESVLAFSTRDKDHDQKSDLNCAKQLTGGWWFSNCGKSNLNGRYFVSAPPKQRHQRKQGIFWKTWHGRYYPLKSSMMMITPAKTESK